MSLLEEPMHPGGVLKELYLAPLDMGAIAFARRLGVPRTRIERLIKGTTGITPDTALRLARVFSTTPAYWVNLQTSYDMALAAKEIDVSDLEPLEFTPRRKDAPPPAPERTRMKTVSEANGGMVFQATTFEGKISAGGFEQSLTFVAHAGEDCRLVVDPLTVAGKAFVAFSKSMGKPGGHAEPITLAGKTRDGLKFFSRHMEIRGLNSGSNGHQIRLGTGEASITLPRNGEPKSSDVGLKLSLRGFKSFRPSPVKAQLGTVVVQGAHKVLSPDEVSGAIFVQSKFDTPDENWFQEAGTLADFVWRGLQFGHGGRLHVPLIQEYRVNEIVATFYNGSGRPAHLPAIHFLDQSDFIAALVARFENDDPFPDAVWQAVGWLNNDSSIDEVRYLTLMTAVETILHSLVPEAQSTLMSKPIFKPINEALISALSEFDIGQEETDILAGNIKGINRAPMSRKLKAVIEKYGLPSDVFGDDLIRRLNKQRNSITHKGKALDGERLWDCILHAREMIALIVFAELRYKGRYQSYAQGHEQRSMS